MLPVPIPMIWRVVLLVCLYRVYVVVEEGYEECGGRYAERGRWRDRRNEKHGFLLMEWCWWCCVLILTGSVLSIFSFCFWSSALVPGLYCEAFRINDSARVLPGWCDVVGRLINNSRAFRINDSLSWCLFNWVSTPVFLGVSTTSLGDWTIVLYLARVAGCFSLLEDFYILSRCDEWCWRSSLMLIDDVSLLLSLFHALTCCVDSVDVVDGVAFFFLISNGDFCEAFRINDSPRVLPGWRDGVGRLINSSEMFRVNDSLSWFPFNWVGMPVFLRVSAASLGAGTILLYLARGAGCGLLVGDCNILSYRCNKWCWRSLLMLIDDVSLILLSLFHASTWSADSLSVLDGATIFLLMIDGAFCEAFRINDSPCVLPWWRDVVGRLINSSGAFRINDSLSRFPFNWFSAPVFLRVSAASLGTGTILLYLTRGTVCGLFVGGCNILSYRCDEWCWRSSLMLMDDVSLIPL